MITKTSISNWLIFYKDQLLLKKVNSSYTLPCSECSPIQLAADTSIQEFSLSNDTVYKTYSIEQPIEESEEYVMYGLRDSYNLLSYRQYQLAGKAYEILHWDRSSRFCPICASPMEQKAPIMKKCPSCGNEMYPNISTAVLVLLRKDDSLLLVHAHNFKGTFNSLIAGFLETGETLEECVAREVKEETNLDVKNITYFANQPWPYPSGLMVGFIADYAGGELKLQEEELSSGAFYTKDNLPELPRKLSLARRMIDWWIASQDSIQKQVTG